MLWMETYLKFENLDELLLLSEAELLIRLYVTVLTVFLTTEYFHLCTFCEGYCH